MRRSVCAAAGALLGAVPAGAQAGLSLDEVVRTTLASSAGIEAARLEVEGQRGALRRTQGVYDPALGAGLTTLRAPTPIMSEQGVASFGRATRAEYRVGVDRRLRSGVTFSPSVLVTRTDVGAGSVPYSQAEAAARLTVPLLRGRGESLERADERAAASVLAATEAELRHRRSLSVLDAVLAYWDYVAAARRVEVLRHARDRATTLLAETETLIRADLRPAIDAVPLRATVASRRADVIEGEDALLGARQTLAVAMGISPERFLALAAPSTPFPDGSAAGVSRDSALVDEALRRRADLASARSRHEAARSLLSGARADRRPQVDLRMTAGVAGVQESRELGPLLTPFHGDRGGFHLELDVAYAIPVRNRAAAGAALQRAAQEEQSALQVAELTRTLTLNVLTAAASLRGSLQGLEQASEAVRLHTQSLEAEKSKFRLGTSTLFDVLFAEDALTGATLYEINARQRVAGALARLRFHSGQVGDDGDVAALAAPGAR